MEINTTENNYHIYFNIIKFGHSGIYNAHKLR